MSDFFKQVWLTSPEQLAAYFAIQQAENQRDYGINDTCATSLGFAGRRFELSMERLILGHRN